MFKFDELAIFRLFRLHFTGVDFSLYSSFDLLLLLVAISNHEFVFPSSCLHCTLLWFYLVCYFFIFFFGLVCFLVLRAPFFPLCALWCDSAVLFLYCFDVILFNKFNFRKRSSLQRDDYFCRPNRFREFRQVG